MILEAGEHQKPLKGGEETQSAASGQYHRVLGGGWDGRRGLRHGGKK